MRRPQRPGSGQGSRAQTAGGGRQRQWRHWPQRRREHSAMQAVAIVETRRRQGQPLRLPQPAPRPPHLLAPHPQPPLLPPRRPTRRRPPPVGARATQRALTGGGSVEFRPAGGLSPHQAEGGGDGGEGGRRFPEPLTPTFHKATRSPCGRGLVGTYWQDPRSYYCGPSVSSVLPQEKSSYCFLLPLGGRLNAWGDHWGDRTIVFRCVKGPWGIYQSGDA